MTDVEELLRFTGFYHAFREVKRQTWVRGSKEFENDAEHSYELALLGWFIISSHHLPLDTTRVLKYALAHDLLETYAGDTGFFNATKEEKDSKADREAAAIERIAQEFPDFEDLHSHITEYESQSNAEARFVYALDKLAPILNNYLDKGHNWKRESITLEQVVVGKDPKIAVSPEIDELWHALKPLLRQDERELFES